MKTIPYISFITLTILLAACTPHSVREAEKVVTQADSLWQAGKMYGVDEGDSVSLAQAYETLQEHSAFSRQLSEVCPFVRCTSLLRTYSHACYHYGKLLRAKDNPVASMRVFIDATHSRTKDYHILGRVYSNMGSICHLAGEYSLSYDMYEKSAHVFLQDGDSLSYYYLLNDMAFELAMCADKDGALSLIKRIENECWDQGVQAKVNETKAELYLQIHQYDSAIHYASLCAADEAIGAIIKAQAFALSDYPDSSLCYANKVLANSNASYQDRFNAIYIITHFDSTLCAREIAELSSQREDIRYYEYEPDNEKLSNAINLLKQDLYRKSDLRWLYAIVATILAIGIVLLIYIHRKRRQHQLLSQQIEDLTLINNAEQLHHEQIVQAHSDYKRIRMGEIEYNCAAIIAAETFPKNIHWNNYSKMCKTVDDNFYMLASKLHKKNMLNETEVRLCVLVLLNMGRNQISDILPYASNGVGKLKYRVAQKLGTDSKNLREYLISMLINNIAKD